MGIWTKPGQEDAGMLAGLRQLAQGYDGQGQPVDRQTQIDAIRQYQDIQDQKGRRFIEKARQESDAQLTAARAEAERKRAEAEKQRAETEAEVERRRVGVEEDRLRLDAIQKADRLKLETLELTERLQIDKADVLVRALRVAVDGGVDPNQLLAAIQGLGDRLLPGPTSVLRLEDKEEKDA